MDNYTKDKNSVRIQETVCDKQIVTDLSSDFSLPDYQPEIKRLLHVRATVSPPDKYIGTGNAEFSGNIDYAILYAANDGALYCITEASEYRFSIPVEMSPDIEVNEGLTCDVDVIPDMTAGRAAAPRKLSVKCRLRAHVHILGIKCIEEAVEKSNMSDVQRLCGEAVCARQFVGIGEPLQLGDEILPDTNASDLRVISADGQVFVTEAVAGSGSVNCRGEVCLKLLCTQDTAHEPPSVLLRRIPFTQAVAVDGTEVNCDACADGVCSDLHVTVEEGRILCEVTVRLRAKAQRNESISFTRDLYSTEADCETVYHTYTFPRALKMLNGNFSLNTTLPLEQAGIRPNMQIADIALQPTINGLEYEHGKYYLIGRCRAQAVLFDTEEICAQEFELPFRYEAEGTDETVKDYDATVTVLSCRARLDGERIGVDAELSVCLTARGESSFEMLTEAYFGEALARSNAVYTICYPSREDTLWSIAKRYHRPVSAIADTNNLAGAPAADSPESLNGIGYLLV